MATEKPYPYYNALAEALNVDVRTLSQHSGPTHQHLWKLANGQARLSFAAAAVGTLENFLTTLSASSQVRRQIGVGGLDLEGVVAWYLYAQQRRQMATPIPYTLQQAAAARHPPDLYWRFSHLSWELWRTYTAVWALKPLLPDTQLRRFTGFPSFHDWGKVYGRYRPNDLPFQVGKGLDGLDALLTPRHSAGGNNAISSSPDLVSPADNTAWKATLGELSLQMTRATFNTWLQDARLVTRHDDEFTIGVRNTYAKDWLEQRLSQTIARTLAAITGRRPVRLRFVVVDTVL